MWPSQSMLLVRTDSILGPTNRTLCPPLGCKKVGLSSRWIGLPIDVNIGLYFWFMGLNIYNFRPVMSLAISEQSWKSEKGHFWMEIVRTFLFPIRQHSEQPNQECCWKCGNVCYSGREYGEYSKPNCLVKGCISCCSSMSSNDIFGEMPNICKSLDHSNVSFPMPNSNRL